MENPSAGRNLCRTWKSVAMEKGTDSCGKYFRIRGIGMEKKYENKIVAEHLTKAEKNI